MQLINDIDKKLVHISTNVDILCLFNHVQITLVTEVDFEYISLNKSCINKSVT